MPTPIKPLPGQQLINLFMQTTTICHTPGSPAGTASNQALRQSPAQIYQNIVTANVSPNTAGHLSRKRRIIDSDDDDAPLPIKNQAPPIERIIVHDTENESDANFAVILQQSPRPQHLPQSDQPVASERASNLTHRRSQRKRQRSPPALRNQVRTIEEKLANRNTV
jgi:hypothetical protein